jgi:transmembrane sensor
MEKERITDIILRLLSGECTESEKKELLTWRNASNANSEYFEKIKYTWISSAQLRKDPAFDSETALNDLRAALTENHDQITSKDSVKPDFQRVFVQKVLKYAAIFILIFLTGGASSVLLFKNLQKKTSVALCYYEIPVGSKGKTVLPDGTQVWLNAGSRLSYATDYDNQSRVVKLEGEGYFDVITNPEKPFVVKAKGLDIKAYGTAFNVKAYTEEKEVVTTLVRGKVFITGKDKQNKSFTVQMKPNQCITYLTDGQSQQSMQSVKEKRESTNTAKIAAYKITEESIAPIVTINSVKTELYTSWKDKRWVIENAGLPDFIKELERRYNVIFSIHAEELNGYHFSGTIENESIEQVLTILRFALPLKYTINKNQIDLLPDSELKTKYMRATN